MDMLDQMPKYPNLVRELENMADQMVEPDPDKATIRLALRRIDDLAKALEFISVEHVRAVEALRGVDRATSTYFHGD